MLGPVWQFQEAVVGFEQEGGEVTRVFTPDGRTVFARDRATVSGTVFDSTSGTGLAGAFVRLAGTSHVTISQVDGSYWLTDLPEGEYTVTFTHPRTARLGFTDSPDRAEVDLDPGSVTSVDLAVPSPEVVVELMCGSSADAGQGLLVGRVTEAIGDSVVAGAAVRAVWLQAGPEGTVQSWQDTVTDAEGVYRMCVPRGFPLSIEVTAEDLPMTSVPSMFSESPVHELDIRVRSP
jgi:hypothetical protein